MGGRKIIRVKQGEGGKERMERGKREWKGERENGKGKGERGKGNLNDGVFSFKV